MSFLHPLALLGLAAAAIPALLHLLERRVPPEAEFPPIRYLSEAERQSARRLKLRHLLLLVLRTTLIALIVMAAARPLVRSRGPVAGEAHEPTALALVLDNSPSSGAVMDGRPLIERLKAAARAAIGRAATGDRLWLMLSDGVARAGSRDALLATVDSVVPGWRRLDLTEAVARATGDRGRGHARRKPRACDRAPAARRQPRWAESRRWPGACRPRVERERAAPERSAGLVDGRGGARSRRVAGR